MRFFGNVCVFFFPKKKKQTSWFNGCFFIKWFNIPWESLDHVGWRWNCSSGLFKNDCWFRKKEREQYLSLSYLMQSIFWFPIFFLYELLDQPLFMKPVLIFYLLVSSFEIKCWLYYFDGTCGSSMKSCVCVYDYLVCTSYNQVIIRYTGCQGAYLYLGIDKFIQ